MSCAEYWESQGVDPLDAVMTVGCPDAASNSPSQLFAVAIIAVQVAIALWLAAKPSG